MDSQVVNELAEHYQKRVLRFTPKVYTQFGVRRDSVSLWIEEISLSCVLYETTTKSGVLLTSMSDREMELFLSRKESSTKVVVTRRQDENETPKTYHIPAHIDKIVRPKEGNVYCLVHINFIRLPHEIKEFLVTHFFQMDQADAFVANLVDIPFVKEDIKLIFRSLFLSIQKDTAAGERLKITHYSAKTIKVFGEIEGVAPVEGENVELIPFQGDPNCLVQGVCTKLTTYPEIPGFFLLEISQTLNLAVVTKLMKMTKTARTPFLPTNQ